MKAGLLEQIKEIGHWRVNFRPVRAVANELSLAECRALVEKARVSTRGWDFPHINFHRHDRPDEGGYDNAGDHVESWTDWYGFAEFWRMYRSTQFLSYVALREDTMKQEHVNPTGAILDVTSTVYSVTEFVEFASRLAGQGLYTSGVSISISLAGIRGRCLSGGTRRFRFSHPHTTTASDFEFKRTLSWNQIKSDEYRSLAIDMCVDVFDQFGWNPDRSQVEADQESFYLRQF